MEIKINALSIFQESPEVNCFELVHEDGAELTLQELKQLNEAGLVYHSEQTDIDFEDEDENGKITTRYMNIYYFSKASEHVHLHQMPY